jgi:hypothetical protein
MKSSACARRVMAATTALSPLSESVPGERAARVSRYAVAYETHTDEVNKDRALRSLAIRGAERVVRMAPSWGWAAAHAWRRDHCMPVSGRTGPGAGSGAG